MKLCPLHGIYGWNWRSNFANSVLIALLKVSLFSFCVHLIFPRWISFPTKRATRDSEPTTVLVKRRAQWDRECNNIFDTITVHAALSGICHTVIVFVPWRWRWILLSSSRACHSPVPVQTTCNPHQNKNVCHSTSTLSTHSPNTHTNANTNKCRSRCNFRLVLTKCNNSENSIKFPNQPKSPDAEHNCKCSIFPAHFRYEFNYNYNAPTLFEMKCRIYFIFLKYCSRFVPRTSSKEHGHHAPFLE